MQLAKQQLEMALRSAQREVMLITDAELADVHYKLGRICWTMGGHMQTEPHQARAHFEAATAVESDVQVGTEASTSSQWLRQYAWSCRGVSGVSTVQPVAPLHLLSAAGDAAERGHRGGAA